MLRNAIPSASSNSASAAMRSATTLRRSSSDAIEGSDSSAASHSSRDSEESPPPRRSMRRSARLHVAEASRTLLQVLGPVLRAQAYRNEREALRGELERALGVNSHDDDDDDVFLGLHRPEDDWDEDTRKIMRGLDSEVVKELGRFSLSVDNIGRLVVEPNLRYEVQLAAASIEPRARVLRLSKITADSIPPLVLRNVALFLRNCPMLLTLPDNMRIEGSLIIDLCPRLTSLGNGFELTSGAWSTEAFTHLRSELRHARPRASWENLLWAGIDSVKRAEELSDRKWYEITSRRRSTLTDAPLPSEFRVRKPDIITPSSALKGLPNSVDGFAEIDCRKCNSLAILPDMLCVDGDANFQWCSSVTELPAIVEIGGNLDLSSCKALQTLPHNIHVAGDLVLRQATSLRGLPDVLEVGGDLKCGGLRSLQTLGQQLIVHGSLDCSASRSLEYLPEILIVENDLNCSSCMNLVALPSELSVGGDVYLERCEKIDSLPSEMLGWPAREDGEPHDVFLGNSGLSVTSLEWLRNVEAPFLRFHVSLRANRRNEEAVDVPPFPNFTQAVSFWLQYAATEQGDPISLDFTAEDVSKAVDDASKHGVLVFLSRLRGAKEFLLTEMRPRLACRVLEVLEILVTDEVAREEIILRMVDSTDACDDKPIWALNQMHLQVETARARGSEAKLRSLARRVMNLQVVHEHAMAKCNSLGYVDDVCVYLRFEIALMDDLNLPVSALAMHFPKFMEIKDRELDAARQEALAITDEQVEAFLVTWPEWQRFQREEIAADIRWDELPEMRAMSLRRSLRDLFGSKVKDPVIFRGKQWSMNDLLRHWVAHGVDFNNVPVTAEEILSGLSRPKNSRVSRKFWSFYIE